MRVRRPSAPCGELRDRAEEATPGRSSISAVSRQDDGRTGHLAGLLEPQERETRRDEVGQRRALAELEALARDDERNGVRRVRGVRVLAVGFEHLLGVAVV